MQNLMDTISDYRKILYDYDGPSHYTNVPTSNHKFYFPITIGGVK